MNIILPQPLHILVIGILFKSLFFFYLSYYLTKNSQPWMLYVRKQNRVHKV